MKIPWDTLSGDALQQIIEAFVLREGTDYGQEFSLEEKCDHVRAALKAGTAEIVFDTALETVDIRPVEAG